MRTCGLLALLVFGSLGMNVTTTTPDAPRFQGVSVEFDEICAKNCDSNSVCIANCVRTTLLTDIEWQNALKEKKLH